MTAHKKEILTYFEPDNLKWVTGEIGSPPLDVSGVAILSSLNNDIKLFLNETNRCTA